MFKDWIFQNSIKELNRNLFYTFSQVFPESPVVLVSPYSVGICKKHCFSIETKRKLQTDDCSWFDSINKILGVHLKPLHTFRLLVPSSSHVPRQPCAIQHDALPDSLWSMWLYRLDSTDYYWVQSTWFPFSVQFRFWNLWRKT